MAEVIGGAAIIACLCMVALGLMIVVLGDDATRRGGAMWIARGLVLLGVVLLAASVLGGCAPPQEPITAPAWMLTPVPTADVGVDALHAWNCVTAPETICTEWHKPVTN